MRNPWRCNRTEECNNFGCLYREPHSGYCGNFEGSEYTTLGDEACTFNCTQSRVERSKTVILLKKKDAPEYRVYKRKEEK